MMQKKKVLPEFENETEEAQWFFEHQDELLEALKARGQFTQTEQILQPNKKAESKNIVIRMPVTEIQRAKELAERRGLRYQTYIKMLLHEAMDKEEQRIV